MILELKGKYTDAKIFTDLVEESAMQICYNIINSSVFEGVPVRWMPDIHAGIGTCVGTSYPIDNVKFINPGHIGVDIGCMMTCGKLSKPISKDDFAKLEHRIRQKIKFGQEIQDAVLYDEKEFHKAIGVSPNEITKILEKIGMDVCTFYRSIGSVGGGNHFIELGEDEAGNQYITVHCGSRNFGNRIGKYWISISEKRTMNKKAFEERVQNIKATITNRKEWPELIKKAKEESLNRKYTGYLEGDEIESYLNDMKVAQAYAKFNHRIIMKFIDAVLMGLGSGIGETIESVHNYISFKDNILRKGAISAHEGEYCIIPFNMRDGIAICKGKGNPDWNYTAPHGAGRVMSRAAAKKMISMETFERQMNGIVSTSVVPSVIDEAPDAYKPMESIIENIKDTVDILFMIRPLVNWKSI